MAFSTTVNVSAKANSVSGGVGADTGVFVQPGETLIISVDPADVWSLGTGSRTGNADGLGNPLGGDFGTFSRGGFTFRFGTLVGSLDGGQTFFRVGTSLTLPVRQQGTLTLYCWDSNNGDNLGALSVDIRVV